MNHDGLVVLGAHLPNGIESRVVGLDIGAVGILQLETENLVDLQARAPARKQRSSSAAVFADQPGSLMP